MSKLSEYLEGLNEFLRSHGFTYQLKEENLSEKAKSEILADIAKEEQGSKAAKEIGRVWGQRLDNMILSVLTQRSKK